MGLPSFLGPIPTITKGSHGYLPEKAAVEVTERRYIFRKPIAATNGPAYCGGITSGHATVAKTPTTATAELSRIVFQPLRPVLATVGSAIGSSPFEEEKIEVILDQKLILRATYILEHWTHDSS
jgi:hypothetical protein